MTPYFSLIGGAQNTELRNAIQQGALNFSYKGRPCWKDPFDLAIYTLLLTREQPKTIIEIGSAHGGSAWWLHDMQNLLVGDGLVLSIDHSPEQPHSEIPGLVFMQGDAHRLGEVLADRMPFVARPLLVIEDSSHEPETTYAVMRFFDAWLIPGEMIVVEDGNADELYPGRHKDGGPLTGVFQFIRERGVDYRLATEYCHYFGHNVTWNPDGYWRRVS